MARSMRSFGMVEKKIFYTGLMISACVHIVMIGLLSLSKSPMALFSKRFKTIEVTYQNVKQLKEKRDEIIVRNLKVTPKPEPPPKQKVKVLTKKNNMFSVIEDRMQDISKLSGQLLPSEKKIPKITVADLDRKITLPPLGTTKITNPKYITYNDGMRETIRQNIRQRAYTYVNHTDFEAGKVYLTFVLASSGLLKGVQIIEGKTSANNYLREVALRSIKESNPFPPFPEGFDYPEFTFNLLISFQD